MTRELLKLYLAMIALGAITGLLCQVQYQRGRATGILAREILGKGRETVSLAYSR